MSNKFFRKTRTSNKIKSTASKPRLLVFRSSSQIYASVVDQGGIVIASASSLKTIGSKPLDAAKKVGEEVAKVAIKNKVSQVVFDRNGYRYHGRVKAIADGAREGAAG